MFAIWSQVGGEPVGGSRRARGRRAWPRRARSAPRRRSSPGRAARLQVRVAVGLQAARSLTASGSGGEAPSVLGSRREQAGLSAPLAKPEARTAVVVPPRADRRCVGEHEAREIGGEAIGVKPFGALKSMSPTPPETVSAGSRSFRARRSVSSPPPEPPSRKPRISATTPRPITIGSALLAGLARGLRLALARGLRRLRGLGGFSASACAPSALSLLRRPALLERLPAAGRRLGLPRSADGMIVSAPASRADRGRRRGGRRAVGGVTGSGAGAARRRRGRRRDRLGLWSSSGSGSRAAQGLERVGAAGPRRAAATARRGRTSRSPRTRLRAGGAGAGAAPPARAPGRARARRPARAPAARAPRLRSGSTTGSGAGGAGGGTSASVGGAGAGAPKVTNPESIMSSSGAAAGASATGSGAGGAGAQRAGAGGGVGIGRRRLRRRGRSRRRAAAGGGRLRRGGCIGPGGRSCGGGVYGPGVATRRPCRPRPTRSSGTPPRTPRLGRALERRRGQRRCPAGRSVRSTSRASRRQRGPSSAITISSNSSHASPADCVRCPGP